MNRTVASLLLLLPAQPAFSEEVAQELEEITVTAEAEATPPAPSAFSPQTVVEVPRETLRRNAAATLGETLGWEPGVSSGYFGPGASRPIIRGFEGVRVRTLRDDLGTFDLSDISPDHGVALEPFLLESAEIHRGPAALLYGGAALGGAVNTRSLVMPREIPDQPVGGGIEARHETQGNALANSGLATFAAGDFVFRLTGSVREAGDISIPGRARSGDYERMENPGVYDPGAGTILPVPNPSGKLPNSFHEASTWSTAVAWVPQDVPARIGLSWSRFDSRYGVPYSYPGDATDLYGDQSIDMAQDRLDLEGALTFGSGPVTRIEARFAKADYDHHEFFTGKGKDSGRDFTDTTLAREGSEGRVDIHHQAFDQRLTGILALTAAGETVRSQRTVFPPPDLQQVEGELRGEQMGIALLEKYESGEWTARLGARLDHADTRDTSLSAFGWEPSETGWSHSLSGAVTWTREGIGPLDRLAVTGILSQVGRQPTAVERYAFWNNAGIGRFLVGGDLDGIPLETERSLGIEVGLEAQAGPVTGKVNAYHYRIDDFVFLQESPGLTGGFGRAVEYVGRDATFTGFEAGLDWRINDELTLQLMADAVRAENTTDGTPIPRMPPLRFGSRLEWKKDALIAGIEIRHATAQDRVQQEPRPELPADAYTLVNADISRTFTLPRGEMTAFLRATNLLDEKARASTSFRKDTAPLPGRGVSVGLRYEF
ncbi:MAG: TonB-dependent receptor [Akkermansiaceae bacterium]|nr:TonB-dependent receptor [Akkermansiaceae bacterium]